MFTFKSIPFEKDNQGSLESKISLCCQRPLPVCGVEWIHQASRNFLVLGTQ